MLDCAPARCVRTAVMVLSFAALTWLAAAPARAQTVAFQPVVSSFPSGVTLPVTPVVSDDRRYVRMTLAPQFTSIEGFDPFSVPAAVSGGGLGGGGLGGLGGLGGGGGGGGRFVAGMGGVAEPGMIPGALAAGSGASGFASPDAVAFLSGAAGPIRPPRLSATMGGDAPVPRARATKVRRPSRVSKRR
jgi:hypothetical protein